MSKKSREGESPTRLTPLVAILFGALLLPGCAGKADHSVSVQSLKTGPVALAKPTIECNAEDSRNWLPADAYSFEDALQLTGRPVKAIFGRAICNVAFSPRQMADINNNPNGKPVTAFVWGSGSPCHVQYVYASVEQIQRKDATEILTTCILFPSA